jgi:hypothetical protein
MRHSLPLMLSSRLGDFAANGDEVVQERVVARLGRHIVKLGGKD